MSTELHYLWANLKRKKIIHINLHLNLSMAENTPIDGLIYALIFHLIMKREN